MKRLLLASVCLLAPHLARAANIDGVYVNLGIGATFLPSQKAQRVETAKAPIAIQNRKTEYNAGARLLTSVGYGFGNGLRVELEGTVYGNARKRVKGPPVSDSAALVNGQASGYEANAGLFLNAIYEFDLAAMNASLPIAVQPYVGGGIGYLRTSQRDIPRLQSNAGVTRIDGTRDALGIQGILGVAFPIAAVPGLAITTEYRATERTGGRYDAKLTGPGPERRVRLNDDPSLSHSVLIGLRYAFGQTASLPPAAPVPAAAVTPAAAPSRSYLVFFDWDRADLTDRARQVIAEAAQAASRVAVTRIEVAGNADRSGTPAYNLGLSRRRAESVAAELARLGIARDAIAVTALGDTRPLVATAAGVREPQNRRVEIVLR